MTLIAGELYWNFRSYCLARCGVITEGEGGGDDLSICVEIDTALLELLKCTGLLEQPPSPS